MAEEKKILNFIHKLNKLFEEAATETAKEDEPTEEEEPDNREPKDTEESKKSKGTKKPVDKEEDSLLFFKFIAVIVSAYIILHVSLN